jgi:flagellar export protein FliJ
MAFRFTLKAVLRVRESLEKAELQRLQAIASQVAGTRTEIESLDMDMESVRRQACEAVAIGVSGAELRFDALRETVYQERRVALVKKLEELEQLRRAQQQRYTKARQQREILSNLRQRQLAAYQLEQLRREQQQADELFLIRRGSATNE